MLRRLSLVTASATTTLYGYNEAYRLGGSGYDLQSMDIHPQFPWRGFSSTGGTPLWGSSGSEARALAGWRLNNDDLQLCFYINGRGSRTRLEVTRAKEYLTSQFAMPGAKLRAECKEITGVAGWNTGEEISITYETPISLASIQGVDLGGSNNPNSNKQLDHEVNIVLERPSALWTCTKNVGFWAGASSAPAFPSYMYLNYVSSIPANGSLRFKDILRADGQYSRIHVPGTGPHNMALYTQGPYQSAAFWVDGKRFDHSWSPQGNGNNGFPLAAGQKRIFDFGWKEMFDPATNRDKSFETKTPMKIKASAMTVFAAGFYGSGAYTPQVVSGTENNHTVKTGVRVEITPRTDQISL